MSKVSVSNRSSAELLPIMKNTDQWICWAFDSRNDFIPLNIDNYNPRTNRYESTNYKNKSIRLDYETAKQKAETDDAIDGIGFVVVDTNISYIDIDECIKPFSGEINSEIRDLIAEIDSYVEISISGSGLHVYCRGDTPSYGWTPTSINHDISVFDGSWAVVTEDHVAGYPASVQAKPAKLKEICDEYNIDTHGGWG